MEPIDNTIDSKISTEFRNSINYEKVGMETGNAPENKITLVHFMIGIKRNNIDKMAAK